MNEKLVEEKINAHLKALSEHTFLMVCSGETYFTEVVKGPDIVQRMMVAMCGDNEADWEPGEKEFWKEHINDRDNWCDDSDYGPTHFHLDVGETDHVDLFLMTHLIPPHGRSTPKQPESSGEWRVAKTCYKLGETLWSIDIWLGEEKLGGIIIARIYGKSKQEAEQHAKRIVAEHNEFPKLQSQIREMQGNYDFGAQVLNRVVLPNVQKLCGPYELPVESLERMFNEHQAYRQEIQQLQSQLVEMRASCESALSIANKLQSENAALKDLEAWARTYLVAFKSGSPRQDELASILSNLDDLRKRLESPSA